MEEQDDLAEQERQRRRLEILAEERERAKQLANEVEKERDRGSRDKK